MQKAITTRGTEFNVSPTTQTTDNIYGDEINTTGAQVTHKGFLIPRPLKRIQGKEGDFKDADALAITNGSVILNQGDIIDYSGVDLEVRETDHRKYNGTAIYGYARLYRVTGGI